MICTQSSTSSTAGASNKVYRGCTGYSLYRQQTGCHCYLFEEPSLDDPPPEEGGGEILARGWKHTTLAARPCTSMPTRNKVKTYHGTALLREERVMTIQL